MLPGAELGALTQLWAATSLEGAEFGGKVSRFPYLREYTTTLMSIDLQYLIPWARMGEAKKETENTVLAQKLWDWLAEQAQKHQG